MKININVLREAPGVVVDEAHDWGYQLRLVNNETYCGKLLVLTEGEHGSHHRHQTKDEVFVVLKGEVFVKRRFRIGLLRVGDSVRMEPGVAHEMWAKEIPSVLLEVSTHDDDLDYEKVGE